MLTLGSLFDGIGGFPLAGIMCGIKPVWASEIEPFPCKVTAARFPEMEQLGDVTKIDGAKVTPVDIITFGSPCQDLSVAGLQKGIHDGERSNLFFEAIRIIREMRNATANMHPRFAVWENVPGAFSSNSGEDFRSVLQAFAGVCEDGLDIPGPPKGKWRHAGGMAGNGWSVAWRVYDAQYWGVPQRRKRIYLVADFAGERAHEILFERESVCRDSPESRAAGEGAAADAEGSVGGSSLFEPMSLMEENWRKQTVKGALRAEASKSGHCIVSECYGVDCYNQSVTHDKSKPLTSSATDSDHIPCIIKNVVCVQNTGKGWWNQSEIAQTIRTPCGGDSTKANLIVKVFENHSQDTRYTGPVETSQSVVAQFGTGGNNTPFVVEEKHGQTAIPELHGVGGISATIDASYYKGPGARNGKEREILAEERAAPGRKYIVRRLTPTECARLQGFPDWWCEGLGGSDSAIYKAYGNGLALPCAYDVLSRIAGYMEEKEEI